MAGRTIAILVNEKRREVSAGITAGALRDQLKPDADILIVNGFPAMAETELHDGDQVVLIRRGEIPPADDLEALMVARHTPHVHARMKRAVVGIAGLGGLGSNVAIALARMGVGTLILADFDVVEPSNLNRQQYAVEHLGMPKIDAMSSIVRGINPYLEVICHGVVVDRTNIAEIFGKAHIIAECFDRAEAKAMLIQSAGELLPEAYVVGASGLAGYGESNAIQSVKLGEKVFMVGDFTSAAEPGRGLMAPRVGIAAGHQANLVVSLIMDPNKVAL